jgi:hypothetical protein
MSEARDWAPPLAELDRLAKRSWQIGALGAAACALGAWLDPDRFARSYLVAWLLWLGIALGCLAILCLHHLTRGAWGLMIRRVLEAASRTLPYLAVLFTPVLLYLPRIYGWANPERAAEMTGGKATYLTPLLFSIRFILYFAVWTAIAYGLSAMSRRQDETGDPGLFRRMQVVAAPALGLYALTATFASVDWLMSLDPDWYSSIFGAYFIGGQAVSAFAFIVPVAVWLRQREPMSKAFRPNDFQDYGKLMLAFVMLWAYFAVSQLLIIWSGNLAEEVTWYVARVRGYWKLASIALGLGHFALPFALLLSRDLKRSRRLIWVALFLLVMRWFDLFWQTFPAFAGPTGEGSGFLFHWLDLATVVAVGGVWFALFARQLAQRPLLPINDPFLPEALERA